MALLPANFIFEQHKCVCFIPSGRELSSIYIRPSCTGPRGSVTTTFASPWYLNIPALYGLSACGRFVNKSLLHTNSPTKVDLFLWNEIYFIENIERSPEKSFEQGSSSLHLAKRRAGSRGFLSIPRISSDLDLKRDQIPAFYHGAWSPILIGARFGRTV